MDLRELRRLAGQGEGQHLEFKKKATHPEKIVREMVAFANSGGGRLLLGVSDNGSIEGLKNPDDDKYVMEAAIIRRCKPAIEPKMEAVHVGHNRYVLVYSVRPSEQKPVFVIYNFRRKRGRAYVRVADRSVQASREVRQVLKGRHHARELLINYNEQVRLLMGEIEREGSITLERYAELSGRGRQETAQHLVELVLGSLLEILPGEEEDRYILNPASFDGAAMSEPVGVVKVAKRSP